jgi:hypothetical protein
MNTPFIKITLAICLLTCFFSSCSQEEDVTYQLNSKLVELKCDKTFALQVSPALPGLTYTSLNTNIATVNKQGLITSKLAGTTNIVVKDSLNKFNDTVKVIVNSQYNSFRDPCLTFGANDITIFKQMKAFNYSYYSYNYPEYNCMYYYDSQMTETLYYLYYFSKSNKLLFSRVYIQDYGDLDWHIASRYSLMKNFHYTYTYMYADSSTYSYSNEETYYISPDSSLIVFLAKSSGSQLNSIFYFPAIKEVIQQILSTDDDQGSELYSWLISYYLYPESNQTINAVKKKKVPEILRLPEKQIQGLGYP